MKIVSWNMNHWIRTPDQRKDAWNYLRGLKPDYALLQETAPADDIVTDKCVYRDGGIGGTRQWGSAVVSFSGRLKEITEAQSPYGKNPVSLHRTYPGTLAVAQLYFSDIVLVSAYGLIEEGYAVTIVHKLLSDLTPLLDSELGRNVILAGDLNVSTQLSGIDRKRHRNLMERFTTVGLVDCLGLQLPPREKLEGCPCEDNPCLHVRTQRHSKSPTPWQNDYMFVSRALASRVLSCRTAEGDDADPWKFSDHCPLVLELRDVVE